MDDVSLIYPSGDSDFYALKNVSLSVGQGQFVALMGPSGSGKSSMLYLLAALKEPSLGRVHFRHHDLTALTPVAKADLRRRHFGFIFQQHFLINYLTVLENVLVGCPKVGPAERKEATDLLERLGLGDHMRKQPLQLSGGQRQRVAAIRAIMGRPDVVFADEPTAALDHKTGLQLVDELGAYVKDGGTLVLVTHDPSIVAGAHRVVRVTDGSLAE